MKTLTEYILVRMEPTLHGFEFDGYDKTIEDFKRQLDIVINDYKMMKEYAAKEFTQQNNVKSCEGCKHLKHNLSIGAAYCTKPCNDYSHYQPKEK